MKDLSWIGYLLQGLVVFFTGVSAITGFVMRKQPRWKPTVASVIPRTSSPSAFVVRLDNCGNGEAHNVNATTNNPLTPDHKLKNNSSLVKPGESVFIEVEVEIIDTRKLPIQFRVLDGSTVTVTWNQPPLWNRKKNRIWKLSEIERNF